MAGILMESGSGDQTSRSKEKTQDLAKGRACPRAQTKQKDRESLTGLSLPGGVVPRVPSCLRHRTPGSSWMDMGEVWTPESSFQPSFVFSAHNSENKPRRSNSEQTIPVHSESEERRF